MLTTKEICKIVGGKLKGSPDIEITSISKIDNAKKGSITFIANDKYTKYLKNLKASAVIVDIKSSLTSNGNNYTAIQVGDVYF